MVHRADEAGGIGGRRQEVVLEPVQILDRRAGCFVAWAFSATLLRVSTPALNSSSVGPGCVNWPIAEWIGPQRISQSKAAQRSRTFSSLGDRGLGESAGPGEIGLVSGVMTVTAVALRPRLLSRLPSRS